MDKPKDSCKAWGLAEAAAAAASCSAVYAALPRTAWLESGAHLQAQPHQQVQSGVSPPETAPSTHLPQAVPFTPPGCWLSSET